jgi:hypothetical protein
MQNKSIEMGYRFLDVYTLPNRGDELSNEIWHIDDVHLAQLLLRNTNLVIEEISIGMQISVHTN